MKEVKNIKASKQYMYYSIQYYSNVLDELQMK